MIRILHTSDWHLGQYFFGYDRADEHEHFLSWLAETCLSQRIDVLLIAGDVFDVSNPSAASQRMFYRFIRQVTRLCPTMQLVVIAGNHDSAARLEAPVPLLAEMNTTVKGVVRKCDGAIDYDDLIVDLRNSDGKVEALCLAVPFLRQGDYPATETKGNAYAEGIRAFYHEITGRALERRTGRQALIGMGHLWAAGAEAVEDEPESERMIGGSERIASDAFPEELAYTALGHLHRAQHIKGRENVRFAGSPIPMSFAEKNYRHGVVQITIDGGEATIEKIDYQPLCSLISVPAGKPEPADEVLRQLELLPEATDANANDLAPYLEVRVLITEPEPMLRTKIESIIEHKQVRLARISSAYLTTGTTGSEEKIISVGLHEMNPVQIVRATFQRSYGNDMPEELVKLFEKAMNHEDTHHTT